MNVLHLGNIHSRSVTRLSAILNRRLLIRRVIVWDLLLMLLILFASLTYLYGSLNYFSDLFSHFQLQYTLGGIIWVIIGLSFGVSKKRLTIGALVLLSFYFVISPQLRLLPASTTFSKKADLLFINSNYLNEDLSSIRDLYTTYEPNTVALVESNDQIIELFTNLMGDPIVSEGYAHQRCAIFTTDRSVTNTIELSYHQLIYSTCIAQKDDLYIVVGHPYPPLSEELFNDQEKYFTQVRGILDEIDKQGDDYIFVGDLNSTVYSGLFRRYFGDISKYNVYSWSIDRPWMLPIDHALSNGGIDVYRSKGLSSDHTALFVELDKIGSEQE